MRVFISWSGDRSKALAGALSTWLEQVVQAVEPWLSVDMAKGTRWSPEIAARLEESSIGLICLTPENLSAPWILFEAGALSKTKDALICTFLLGLDPSDVPQPLGQFQHTLAEKDDVKKLIQAINDRVTGSGGKMLSEKALNSVFETYWPSLEKELSQIAGSSIGKEPKQRTQREMLQEVLQLLRAQERNREGLEGLLRNPYLATGATAFGTPTGAVTHPEEPQTGLLGIAQEKGTAQKFGLPMPPSSKGE